MKACPQPLLWSVVCAVGLAGGCAGGAWLERPLAAELPVEGPQSAYPTALGRQASESVIQGQETGDSVPGAENNAAIVSSPGRLQRQQANMPVLAVVPPQFVTHPAPPSPAHPADAGQVHHPQAPASIAAPAATPPSAAPPVSRPAGRSASASLTDLDDIVDAAGSAPGLQHAQSEPPPSHVDIATPAQPVADAAKANANIADASASEPLPLDKKQADFIAALENEIRRRREASATDEELPRLEQQLRLAYVAAGRLDDAVAAVESLDAAQREAYKNLMFGLGVWLSPDEARRVPLRTAKVLHSLRDATTDLAASSKLELRNLVFCERVDYFGWYTEFPRKEFQPKQQVILYVEVQNFAAEQKGPAGYETELQGSYEILDAGGQIIASRQLPLDKEICRNYRRDYFLAYRIYMPDSIAPGHYRLELTVEDLKARGKYQGRKLGEGMIEFAIR